MGIEGNNVIPLNRAASDATKDDAPVRSPLPDDGGPIQILIVDDEPKNLLVLESILNDPGYRLVRAHSADEALLALVTEQFAVLILDIRMPGMTGFELADIIKKRKKTARIPIIFLTAYYSEDQHVLEGYGSGAVDYLHKPVNPQILRSKVAVFAELHRKERESALANAALLTEVKERRNAEERLREFNDTLEQRVAERTEALRQANRLKDEFLAMLGHEVRNPLAAIMNAVQVMHVSGADPARMSRSVALVDRQTQNLRHIVDDLLDVARVTRGKIELRKQPADVVQIVHQAVDVVRPMLSQSEELEINVNAAAPLRAEVDRTRLEQSIVNLLTNAIKFTPQARHIRVTVERDGQNVIVMISDNGIGIASEMQTRIFELFAQADRSLDRSQGGLGIGLFICRRLIELHGGEITAFSEGLGRGSVFRIQLPLLHQSAVDIAPIAETTRRESPARATAKRVLIIDDNADSATSLAWLLNQQGYVVEMAFDGEEGLKAAQAFKPDILLLDIGLPKINGYDLARQLRGEGFTSSLIVAVSGYARDSDIEQSHSAGFDLHLAKPVDIDHLLEVLAAS